MTQESAVQFATPSRIHMGLAVKNLEQSIAFYRALFGQEPTKTRDGYAKFEVAEPPVNLSLNAVGGETGPNNAVAHFGIQVKSTPAVIKVAERLETAGVSTAVEDHVTCCYAVQNKIWATDPDGNKWEVYVVLDNNAAQHASSEGECCSAVAVVEQDAAQHESPKSECCPAVPAIMDAVQKGDLPAAQSAFLQAGGAAACSCLSK